VEPYDPLLHDVALPLAGTFYALGFRVDIATNSQAVLDAALESWGVHGPEFASQPVDLRIVVRPAGDPAPEPVVRTQGHYFSLVSDRDNFAAYDSATFFGYAFVTESTVAQRAWFRFHYLETMAYMLLAQRYVMPVHAACVARGERGILLYGHSGAGKSTLAWACARAGWTYITDDGAWLLPDAEDGAVVGRSRQIRFKADAPRLFPELDEYLLRSGPNGKVSIEVPTSAFPQIRTASRCRAVCVAVLTREDGAAARAEPVAAAEVGALLLGDMPRYGEEVRGRYQAVVGRLLRAPCYRLIYDDLPAAVGVLGELTEGAPGIAGRS
jgi:hypothetical protein